MELRHEFGLALRVAQHDQRSAAWLQHAHQPVVGLPTQLVDSQLRLDGHLAGLVDEGEVGFGNSLLLKLPARQKSERTLEQESWR